ncbi:MAG: UbiD family decarboxylase [Dehalococcoidia bacterium]|nr:UbiD family decarboxylase [Dehalococcoidia bacterium]
MAYYKELREHIKALEAKGKLARIKRPVNKDTELMPIVRWQFRGLPEEERRAFLFENVVDVTGKKYDMPVLVASHAASKDVYAIGLMCEPSKIAEKWGEARRKPIEPVIVSSGPCQEVVYMGDKLLERGGLSELPVPISTPGFDNGPYLSAANWITKDPETGIRNVGNYRGLVKSPTRLGVLNQPPQDMRTHWEKARKMGKPLPAAISIGPVPVVGFVATIKFPLGVDEMAIAGGLAGEPIPLVKCKTVDLEVPATSEIVIEGELPTDSMEREAPFGEYTGFMGLPIIGPYFNVKCITHRKNAIYNAFISQFPPSESSKIRHIGEEAVLYKFLKIDCGLPITEVALHETCGSVPMCVVAMNRSHPSKAWQVLNAIVAISPRHKFNIVVDDDVDPRDAESVNWAMSFRVQPIRDVRIIKGIIASLDYSVAPPTTEREEDYPGTEGASSMLINATCKWDYPPVSLPKQEFMEKARQIWEEEGLPKLKPRKPWFGYNMGYWPRELEEEAELALKGQHFKTGEKLAQQRIKL